MFEIHFVSLLVDPDTSPPYWWSQWCRQPEVEMRPLGTEKATGGMVANVVS